MRRSTQRLGLIGRLLRSPSAVFGLTIVSVLAFVAIFATQLAPYDPAAQDLRTALAPPSWEHPFGTDEFGRDLLSRMIHGSRITLSVGLAVVLLGGVTGGLLGLLAGYFEGWIDDVFSRVIDVQLAFPGLLLAMVIVAVLGPSLTNAMIAVAVETVPAFMRVTRGAVLSMKQNDFVLASRALGAAPLRIILRHILPNVTGPLVVLATLGVGTAILAASSLSFLGLGAQPPTPEWGAILSTGRTYIFRSWILATIPGVAIMITVLAVNLLGDGLQDALDPRLVARGSGR